MIIVYFSLFFIFIYFSYWNANTFVIFDYHAINTIKYTRMVLCHQLVSIILPTVDSKLQAETVSRSNLLSRLSNPYRSVDGVSIDFLYLVCNTYNVSRSNSTSERPWFPLLDDLQPRLSLFRYCQRGIQSTAQW